MNTDRSSYCDGLPETLSRSSRAAAKVSGDRVHSTTANPSGRMRSSSHPKSYARPRDRWYAIVDRWNRSTIHE